MTTQSSKMKIPAHPDTHDTHRDPITGAPGAHPVGSGVGAAGGAAGGAVVGGAIGGPIGAVVGATVGGLAGGLAGKGVAEVVNPTAEDAYWRENYRTSKAYSEGLTYDQLSPGYRSGYMGYQSYGVKGRTFSEAEPQIREAYEKDKGMGGLGWDKGKIAAQEAWNKISTASNQKSYVETSQSPSSQKTISKKSLSQLDSFLRGELSAIGTYRQAMGKFGDGDHGTILRDALASHERRAELLKRHIREGGGKPSEHAGIWGVFAKTYEGGAGLFGVKSAVGALESGEDHGIEDFKRGLDDLDEDCLAFVQREILPEQERTHRAIADLKHRL